MEAPLRHNLHCHPATPCSFIRRLSVSVAHAPDGRLAFDYRLAGDLNIVRLHDFQPVRQDLLWQHTCFEAFIRTPGDAAYREFNFSPSGAWAAYDFSGYRDGMRDAVIDAPQLEFLPSREGEMCLLARVPVLLPGPVELSITAVIEGMDGALSSWALHHPKPVADFHHPDGFVLAYSA